MPNVCENTIEITGSAESIDKLIKDCTTEGYEGRFQMEDELEPVLDLGLAFPMPSEFELISKGGRTINGVQVSEWRIRDTVTNELVIDDFDKSDETRYVPEAIPEKELKLFRELYGATNWYDWRTNNWDTKWVTQVPIARIQTFEYDDFKTISFVIESAWSPPVSLLQKICNIYSVDISDRWWEEGGYAGWEHLEPAN